MAKKTATSNDQVIVHQIEFRQLNRGKNDIKTWRDALAAAENPKTPKRAQLYTLYEEMMLDGHLKATWEKRKNSVRNTRVEFIDNNGKRVDDEKVIGLLDKPWFYDLLGYIMDSILYGHSLIEFETGAGVDRRIEITKAILIDRRHVVPEYGYVALKEGDTSGIPYREEPYYNYVIEVGKPRDFGLLLQASQYVIYKRGGFADLANYAEIFGMPFRKATYNGHDEQTRILLEESMQKAGNSSWAVIPEGSNIEFLNSQTGQGSSNVYTGLIDACNKEISKIILGNTMTTEDGASKSQAEVHENAEWEINIADRKFCEFVLNELRRVLVNYGYVEFDPGKGSFKFDDSEPVDTQIARDIKLAELVEKASGGEMSLDLEEIADKYNVTLIRKKAAPGGEPGKK